MMPLLQSERLLLRAMEPKDETLMYRLENDTTLWDTSVTTVPYSHKSLREFIATSSSDIYADRQLRLVAELRASGEAVGFADLIDFAPRYSRAEVAVAILPAFQRQGLGTEVLQLLTAYAHTHLNIRNLYAYVTAHNTASLRMMERSGYVQTGRLKAWFRIATNFEDAFVVQHLFP